MVNMPPSNYFETCSRDQIWNAHFVHKIKKNLYFWNFWNSGCIWIKHVQYSSLSHFFAFHWVFVISTHLQLIWIQADPFACNLHTQFRCMPVSFIDIQHGSSFCRCKSVETTSEKAEKDMLCCCLTGNPCCSFDCMKQNHYCWYYCSK